jgi:drug/metabolite transporter (DMT)-like permease
MTGTMLHKKTIAVLIPAVFAQAAGNVFVSLRMKELGAGPLTELIPRALGSPALWFGVALLIVSFVLFTSALSWADLSFVVPAVSMEVAVNVVFAKCFLHEAVSPTRWSGVLLISVGVLLVMRTARRKAPVDDKAAPGHEGL